MLQVISHDMRRVAEYLIFASSVTIDELHVIMEVLKKVIKKDENFSPSKENPLILSREGQGELRLINKAIRANDLYSVISRLDKAIRDGSTENPELVNLESAVEKTLRHSNGKWVNVNFRGK